MCLVVHEIVQRDARLLAIRLDHNVGNLGYVAHFRRAVETRIVLRLAELKNGLYVLTLSNHKVIAL